MNKPDHVDIITRQEFLDALVADIEATLASIRDEEKQLDDDHTRNLAPARLLAQLYHEYASMIVHLTGARSLQESRFIFYHDKDTGRMAHKADRLPWSAVAGGYSHDAKPHAAALAATKQGEGQYL